MKTEKDIFVSEIKQHLSQNAGHTTKQKRKRRTIRAFTYLGGLGGITKIALVLVVGGVLVGLGLLSTVVMQQDIPTQGVASAELYFDGTIMTPIAGVWTAPTETFTDNKIIAGEKETFTHIISSPADNGDWDLYWNTGEFMSWFHTPTAEFFGYYFNVTNPADVNISALTVMHGNSKTIKFVHTLDSHFKITPNPIPFSFKIHAIPYVAPPDAVDDSILRHYGNGQEGQTFTVPVLPNDIDNFGTGLTITSLVKTSGPAGITMSIAPDGQSLNVLITTAVNDIWTYTYTIVDHNPLLKTDTATLTFQNVP